MTARDSPPPDGAAPRGASLVAREATESIDLDYEPHAPGPSTLALGTHERRPPAQPPHARTPAPTSRRPSDAEGYIGRVLGSYQVLEVLGTGGMGHVFRAEHRKLGREVAIKLLRGEFASRRDAVARFFQEARTVSRVRHRNIVEITDFVELDDGTTFLVMELLHGRSLGEWADDLGARASRDLPRALAVLVQICDGLAAAHAVGVVHRDLKPDNVLVVPTPDGAELAKLLDFGVAKLLHEDTLGEAIGNITAAGSVIGTPAYMSPEQAGGMAIDARSDIYSLGAIMYELFCGEPMFRGRSFGEYVRKHLTELPVPPRATAGGAHLSVALEAVILRCLGKDPIQRYPTVEHLRDELLALLGSADLDDPARLTLRNLDPDEAVTERPAAQRPRERAASAPPAAPLGASPEPRRPGDSSATHRPRMPSAPGTPSAPRVPAAGHAAATAMMDPRDASRSLAAQGSPTSLAAPASPAPLAAPASPASLAAPASPAPLAAPASPAPLAASGPRALAAHLATAIEPRSAGLSVPATAALPTFEAAARAGRMTSREAAVAHVPPPQPRRAWLRWTLVGAITVTLSASAALWLAEPRTSLDVPAPTPPAPALTATPLATGATGATGAAAAAAAPSVGESPTTDPPPRRALVELRFDSEPTGGVFADGRGAELCQTPCAVNADPGERPDARRRFIVRRDGYADGAIEVDLRSADQSYRVVLQPLTPAAAPARPEAAVEATAPSRATARGTRRDDPPPRAGRDRRDSAPPRAAAPTAPADPDPTATDATDPTDDAEPRAPAPRANPPRATEPARPPARTDGAARPRPAPRRPAIDPTDTLDPFQRK